MKTNKRSNATTKHQKADRNLPDEEVDYIYDNMVYFLTNGKNTNQKAITSFAERELRYFIKHPDELDIRAYQVIKGVNDRTHRKWRERNKKLKETFEQIKLMLALRRQKALFSSNPNQIAHTQHLYCDHWKKGEDRKDARAKKRTEEQVEKFKGATFISYNDVKDIEEAKKKFTKDPKYKEKNEDTKDKV